MKFIVAIIKPHMLDDVRTGLAQLGIAGLTVTEVKGYGRQRGQMEIYRGAEYRTSFVPKAKLEIAVPDDLADDAVAAIREAAQTGKIGDGKIFVLDLHESMRIRTGETGNEAL
ncbi:nitrogen regulatory protein PII [Ameyamaea chiangmaiensis NBRC 103196]|uniref:Nitrogen regulatory protein P-II n=1 Tax=Ameyamaea chiangmaiensis TaxID=442969 RepID=A0A850PGU7_9PROT|nr:P-II family nitrogen regulator [Ameyamaea chiangmaiensis]MBS4076414.1 P-II family nitrogen regulator [Ameyamaea chiangmaiensis]NVN41879.1 P-II family nitrogen regulator [Ameyamaea chiangmaiensis]GBQ61794.1 nitrogen regulatory protein PII [Ameyamaea chiangmaiensis NBRC 103196]